MTTARPVTPVSLLAARLAALVLQAEGSVRAELMELIALAGGLDPYSEQHTSPESPVLAALAARTRERPWTDGLEQEMLSGHVEGQFLAMLVHATRARNVLEIGMFTGYAALAMAEALPAGGRVVTCELDPDVAAFARDAFTASPHAASIDIRVGPARDTLAALAGETFDLVFLDADKAGYVDYVRMLLDTDLLAPHGLLVVDNTLMQGQPWSAKRTPNGDAIAAFNEYLTAEPRVEQVLIPLRDGVTLVRWART